MKDVVVVVVVLARATAGLLWAPRDPSDSESLIMGPKGPRSCSNV